MAAFVVRGIECDGPVGLLLALLYQVISVGIGMLIPAVAWGLLGPVGMIAGLLQATLILWLIGQIIPGYRVEGLWSALRGRSSWFWPGSRRGAVCMLI